MASSDAGQYASSQKEFHIHGKLPPPGTLLLSPLILRRGASRQRGPHLWINTPRDACPDSRRASQRMLAPASLQDPPCRRIATVDTKQASRSYPSTNVGVLLLGSPWLQHPTSLTHVSVDAKQASRQLTNPPFLLGSPWLQQPPSRECMSAGVKQRTCLPLSPLAVGPTLRRPSFGGADLVGGGEKGVRLDPYTSSHTRNSTSRRFVPLPSVPRDL